MPNARPFHSSPATLQVLLPQLRDLEAWLFAEMLKHLWWRVLLQSVLRQQPSAANGTSGASTPAAAAATAGGGFSNSHNMRSAKSAPHLVHAGSGIDRQSPAARQGTPRSFESPEVRAHGCFLCTEDGVARCMAL